MNMEQLVAHYSRVELPLKAHSTAEGYKNYLTLHILPKWGKLSLAAIKSVEVEGWLRHLKKVNGKPASPGTKTKIRNLMSTLFSHAIRFEWAARNPITAVRTSAKRLHTPDILTAEEFQALIQELSQRERVVVLLAGSTGLRRGDWGHKADRVSLVPSRVGTMLRQQVVDLKTAQELLRHANSRITHETYQQAAGSEKRVAQNKAFMGLMGGSLPEHPSAPLEAT